LEKIAGAEYEETGISGAVLRRFRRCVFMARPSHYFRSEVQPTWQPTCCQPAPHGWQSPSQAKARGKTSTAPRNSTFRTNPRESCSPAPTTDNPSPHYRTDFFSVQRMPKERYRLLSLFEYPIVNELGGLIKIYYQNLCNPFIN